jgi:hypothetical protein
VLDGIAVGRPDLAGTVKEGDVLDVVARLVSRSFGGFETLQLEIRDAATSGLHDAAIEAARAGLADGSAPGTTPAGEASLVGSAP